MPRFLISVLLLVVSVPCVRAEEVQCSAIRTSTEYERVAAMEDAADATAELAKIDAQYDACKSKFLTEDREWIEADAANARESLKWPRTIEQAVAEIIADSNPEDMAEVRATKRKDLIKYHMGWGMGIRNSLGLWRGNNALLLSACDGKPCHPDDASMKIIEAVWDRLQKSPPPHR